MLYAKQCRTLNDGPLRFTAQGRGFSHTVRRLSCMIYAQTYVAALEHRDRNDSNVTG